MLQHFSSPGQLKSCPPQVELDVDSLSAGQFLSLAEPVRSEKKPIVLIYQQAGFGWLTHTSFIWHWNSKRLMKSVIQL